MEIEQTYEEVEIDGDVDILKAHPKNPNRGDDAIVDESIEANGWYGAIIAQKSTGYILAGHTRLRRAQARGAKTVPVLWRDVDDETALRILLADNETARRAVMDEDLLGQILDELGDIRGTGRRPEGAGEGQGGAEKPSKEDGAVDAALGAAEDDEEAEDEPGVPGADEVPDDVYTPQYGVMLVVDSEEQQATIYEHLTAAIALGLDEEMWHDVKLRVIAV